MNRGATKLLRVTAIPLDTPRICSDGKPERIVLDFPANDALQPILTREALGYEIMACGKDYAPEVYLIRVQPDFSTFDYERVSDGKGGQWQIQHNGLIRLPPSLVVNAIIQWLSDGENNYEIVDVVNLLED